MGIKTIINDNNVKTTVNDIVVKNNIIEETLKTVVSPLKIFTNIQNEIVKTVIGIQGTTGIIDEPLLDGELDLMYDGDLQPMVAT